MDYVNTPLEDALEEIEGLTKRITELTDERDRAREECGHEKHMRKFASEERDRWIKRWNEIQKVIHHKDGDPYNNDLDNLEVRSSPSAGDDILGRPQNFCDRCREIHDPEEECVVAAGAAADRPSPDEPLDIERELVEAARTLMKVGYDDGPEEERLCRAIEAFDRAFPPEEELADERTSSAVEAGRASASDIDPVSATGESQANSRSPLKGSSSSAAGDTEGVAVCKFTWGGTHHLHRCSCLEGHSGGHICSERGSQLDGPDTFCDESWEEVDDKGDGPKQTLKPHDHCPKCGGRLWPRRQSYLECDDCGHRYWWQPERPADDAGLDAVQNVVTKALYDYYGYGGYPHHHKGFVDAVVSGVLALRPADGAGDAIREAYQELREFVMNVVPEGREWLEVRRRQAEAAKHL